MADFLSGSPHHCFSSDPTASLGKAIAEYGRRFREFPEEVLLDSYGWMCAFEGVWQAAKCGCCPHKVTDLCWMGVKVRPSLEDDVCHNIYVVRGKAGEVRVSWS